MAPRMLRLNPTTRSYASRNPARRPEVQHARSRYSMMICRTLTTTGVLTALTAGAVAFAAPASAQEPPSHTSLVASASQPFVTWPCPFGTRGGKKGACRGGSIGNDIRENGYSYATGLGCAGVGVGLTAVHPAIGVGAGLGCEIVLHDGRSAW